MRIQSLRLACFRNYERAAFTPADGITVLHGENAQGKTNLIEAIHLCCVGRSHRTTHDQDLIRWENRAAQIALTVERREGPREIKVRIAQEGRPRKTIRIDGAPIQRIGELMGHVNAVLFSPEDLRIVKEGPEGRRRFLDMEISQLQPAYFYALQRYMRALTQRNGLLKRLKQDGGSALRDTLDAWDALLVEAGAQIIARRIAYLRQLSEAAARVHDVLSNGRESLTLAYESRAASGEALAAMLLSTRQEDLRRASTGVGPHRDDCRLSLNNRDARAFASQGQQRTIALSLKLAEIEVMRGALGETPILLLDDVMSELDINRRQMLLTRIEPMQTLITCTHLSDLGGAGFDAAYRVEGGALFARDNSHSN